MITAKDFDRIVNDHYDFELSVDEWLWRIAEKYSCGIRTFKMPDVSNIELCNSLESRGFVVSVDSDEECYNLITISIPPYKV